MSLGVVMRPHGSIMALNDVEVRQQKVDKNNWDKTKRTGKRALCAHGKCCHLCFNRALPRSGP